MNSRLERFRTYMVHFNPAANPVDAVREGFYVPRPGRSASAEIAARVELDPRSSHLVVGGIGSGKTTQLLVAGDRLRRLADTRAEYIDVSKLHDLSHMSPGTLLVIAGVVLAKMTEDDLGSEANRARERFLQWAYGHREWVYDEPDDYEDHRDWGEDDGDYEHHGEPGHYVHRPPLLSSPDKPIAWTISEKAEVFNVLSAALIQRFIHIVLLIDSLDRLIDPVAFATVVEEDVRVLTAAGVGIVLVGPLRSMYGTHRSITDHFQHFYPQLALDTQEDPRGSAFMIEVLRKRAGEDMLTPEACARLALLSGGVPRDLISLARAAGEEAYLRDADVVTDQHVETAADAFGRDLLYGLGPEELAVLQRVRKRGVFVQTSDQDLALLVTRRVLEYRNGRARFAVHPTIEPLLAQLDEGGVAP